MGERIEEGYRRRFQLLLTRGGHPAAADRVDRWIEEARRLRQREGLDLPRALQRVHREARLSLGPFPTVSAPEDLHLYCDGSLGGLARWLWAAGLRAHAEPGATAVDLSDRVRGEGGTLLTSDSRFLMRRLVRTEQLRALWVSSSLTRVEQLDATLFDLGLRPGAPRCMACGGELRQVPKAEVADRIPPKTALWLDDYLVCAACDRLFWEGTHWRRMRAQLTPAP